MSSRAPTSTSSIAGKLLVIAWWSIVLGIGIELGLLALAAGFGTFRTLTPFVADLVQKISWSSIVCLGLGVGTASAKHRVPAMGLAGLICAPAAFVVARALHKAAAEVLTIASGTPGGPSPMLLAVVKAIEYACFGALLGWVGSRRWGGLAAHVAAGTAISVTFGVAIIVLTVANTAIPMPHATLVARAFQELVFPVGCALVLFAAERLGSSPR